MSKSAKEVVQDTLNIEMLDAYQCLSCGHHSPEPLARKALRVVLALHSAGWLRDCPWSDEDRIDTLTRERDEAKQLIAEYRKVAERYEANTASPEMLRVVEAAKKVSDGVWAQRNRAVTHGDPIPRLPGTTELLAAVDALAASQHPKAQEPKCHAEGPVVWRASTDSVNRRIMAAQFYGERANERASDEAARLNAAEAK